MLIHFMRCVCPLTLLDIWRCLRYVCIWTYLVYESAYVADLFLKLNSTVHYLNQDVVAACTSRLHNFMTCILSWLVSLQCLGTEHLTLCTEVSALYIFFGKENSCLMFCHSDQSQISCTWARAGACICSCSAIPHPRHKAQPIPLQLQTAPSNYTPPPPSPIPAPLMAHTMIYVFSSRGLWLVIQSILPFSSCVEMQCGAGMQDWACRQEAEGFMLRALHGVHCQYITFSCCWIAWPHLTPIDSSLLWEWWGFDRKTVTQMLHSADTKASNTQVSNPRNCIFQWNIAAWREIDVQKNVLLCCKVRRNQW